MNERASQSQSLSFFQTVGSIGAAFLGVQSSRNRERDFQLGRPQQFIALGIIGTLLFILSLWGVVKLVMMLAIN